MNNDTPIASNFIRTIIKNDLESSKHSKIIMRFPPEPNGYLHIGHIKAICVDFGLAAEFDGICNLRMDDTNPEKEDIEYVNSIQDDIKWLGFRWNGEVKYASDYFDKMYEFAIYFIKAGLAYVCDLNALDVNKYRGDFVSAGIDSPFRNRTIDENLELFTQMYQGKFPDGSKTLRLKIDMSSPNINMRDPVIYRIKYAHHVRTLNKWCIYPMYDYAHCISDALENITHSCCSLEFEDHRPLYDFIVNHLYNANLIISKPRQIEFARLELEYTLTSKRKLKQLVDTGVVSGFNDPRMPTIAGLRRRGYTPQALRNFIAASGVAKSPNNINQSMLHAAIREDLEKVTPKVMAVINPIKVIITNFDELQTLSRDIALYPHTERNDSRTVTLGREIYIEADDFQVVAPNKWHRLSLNTEVRLRHSYIIKCNHVVKDDNDKIIELHCSADIDTLGKNPTDRKVKGVIHWVNAQLAHRATVRLYENLFNTPTPDFTDNMAQILNPNSMRTCTLYVEPYLASACIESRYQFERLGYFIVDRYDSTQDHLLFNQIITLKDNSNL